MAVPKVPTFNDWHFELVNLATGSFTNLDQSIVAISGWVGPGATRHRLESAHIEIIAGTVGATALSWAGIQLLRIVPYADPTHELWGYISKDRHQYTKSGLRDTIKVTVLPVEYLLHSRIIYETDNAAADPVAIATEAAPNNTGGDYAKTLITACTHGRYPTAAAADTRDWGWGTLVVSAQVHDGDAVAPPMSLIGGYLDEAINALGRTYAIDWELYVTVVGGALTFTFNTADTGGTDLTAGASRVIINDIGALVPSAERYFDREGMLNAIHGGSITTAVLNATSITAWGRWEGESGSSINEELQLVLDQSDIKEGSVFDFQASAASEQCQWMDEYEVGDTVIRNNNRLGIVASNEIIQGIEFSFPERVLQTRIRWGNKEPGQIEKRITRGKYSPNPLVPPTLWSRNATSAFLYPTSLGDDVALFSGGEFRMYSDAGTTEVTSLYADGTTLLGGDIYTWPAAPAAADGYVLSSTTLGVLSWVHAGTVGYWEEGDIDATGAALTGLFTRTAAEPVMIGADSSVEVPNWQSDGGYDTKLAVIGNIWVGRAVYSTTNSLVLAGWHDANDSIVHIYDPAGRDSILDIYEGGVADPRIKLVAAIADPSYIRGYLEIQDAAGLVAHSLNGVTGACIFNEQGLDADFRVEAVGLTDAFSIDGATGNVGIGRFPLVDLDVYRAAGGVEVTIGCGNDSPAILNFQNSENSWLMATDDTDWYIYDVNAYVTPLYLDGGSIDMLIHATAAGLVVNEGGAAAGDLRVEADTNDHALFVDATGVGAVEIWNSAPLEMYTDAGGTVLAQINTTGIGWGRAPTEELDIYLATGAIIGLFETGNASNSAIELKNSVTRWRMINSGGGQFNFRNVSMGTDIFTIQVAAPAASLALKSTQVDVGNHLYPGAHNTYDLGANGTRWRHGYYSGNLDVDGTGNVQGTMTMQGAATVGGTLGVTGIATFSTTVNVSGTINADNTGTAIACDGNITMAALKQVDGVDISAAWFDYTMHTHDVQGVTGDWTADPGVDHGTNQDITNAAKATLYVEASTSADGSGATWQALYIWHHGHHHSDGSLQTGAPT